MPRKKTLPIPEPNMDQVVTLGASMKGSVFKLNGKQITEAQLSELKQEAAYFRNTLLYRILLETVKWEGTQIIFNKAENFQDVLNGKSMLHVIGVQERIMKLLE